MNMPRLTPQRQALKDLTGNISRKQIHKNVRRTSESSSGEANSTRHMKRICSETDIEKNLKIKICTNLSKYMTTNDMQLKNRTLRKCQKSEGTSPMIALPLLECNQSESILNETYVTNNNVLSKHVKNYKENSALGTQEKKLSNKTKRDKVKDFYYEICLKPLGILNDEDDVFIPDPDSFQNIFKPPEVDKKKYENTITDRKTYHIEGNFITQQSVISRIKETVKEYDQFLNANTTIDSIIKRPTAKTKLMKKLLKRHSSSKLLKDESKPYFIDIYTTEYLESIIFHEFIGENKYLIENDVIYHNRTEIVDWLVMIMDLLDIHQSTFHTAVRIFDYVCTKISSDKYQLIGICALWIALKNHGTNGSPLLVHKIFSLCNGKYSNNQILSMEHTILKVINFDLVISNPLNFLYFYLKECQLECNKELELATNFILECSSLFPQYASTIPSLIAEAALCLGMMLLECDLKVLHNSRYNSSEELQYHSNLMLAQLKLVARSEFPYREVIGRYSAQHYLNISGTVLEKVFKIEFV
ncbi:G2/mitotic-specific cyclin-A [Aethina tumida]|uniref:G2/mitotic-specific cyclin-A n=1 Tax=Aethina tumida TaxID=116153 RepID=UPI002148FCFC|nr:G2/mitotic-specific cyclin-A [Aethina tumida]